MDWTRTPPESPLKGFPKENYWYLDDDTGEEWVMEVWPERTLHHMHGWWWPIPIERPPVKPPKKEKKNVEPTESTVVKRPRGRPRKDPDTRGLPSGCDD